MGRNFSTEGSQGISLFVFLSFLDYILIFLLTLSVFLYHLTYSYFSPPNWSFSYLNWNKGLKTCPASLTVFTGVHKSRWKNGSASDIIHINWKGWQVKKFFRGLWANAIKEVSELSVVLVVPRRYRKNSRERWPNQTSSDPSGMLIKWLLCWWYCAFV